MAGDPFSSHPYPARKEILPAVYYCEVCDKDMRTVDKNAHMRGKKHTQNVAENTKPEDNSKWSFIASGTEGAKDSKDTRECFSCGEVGHAKADCPKKPRQACHNCGEEGHRKSECTKERQMICRNCEQPGHAAKECPEPPNPANFKCNNCEQMGHKARDCPEPKDWNKVRCNTCQQMGHTSVRCKADPAEINVGSGWDNPSTASQPWGDSQGDGTANGSWDDTVAAKEEPASKSWDDTDVSADNAVPADTPAAGGWEESNTNNNDTPAW